VHTSRRSLAVAIAAVLVLVAILGYVAGHDRSRTLPTETRRSTISAAGVLLAYPSGWQQSARSAVAVPGLSLTNSVLLAPHGDGADAGLLVGQLAQSEPSLLPRAFVARMRSLPDTEVVDLVDTQSYKYPTLDIEGFDRMLDLYTIPNSKGNPTVLACYAAKSLSAYMRACEQSVATLTLAEQSSSYDLVPEPEYARRLSASIDALERQRVGARREMGAGARPRRVQELATRLAAGFAEEGVSLSLLEPPSVTGQVQAKLAQATLQARDAYRALAAAAGAESPPRAAAAQKQVDEAEANVDAELESFALLGYRS
jgi:hypothetical protein